MNKNWTEFELEFIRNNATLTDKELHIKLTLMGARHTFQAVRKMRQRQKIKKEGGRPKNG